MTDRAGSPSQAARAPPSQAPAKDNDTASSSGSGGLSRSFSDADAVRTRTRTRPPTTSRRPVVAGEGPPRLNVGVFSKHKGVRYHRDGQVRSCRFCEILRTHAEEFLFEDEHMVVFRPLRPIVPSHVLIVPRAHIRNVNQLARQHRALLLRMKPVADGVVAKHFPLAGGDERSAPLKRRRDPERDDHNNSADDDGDDVDKTTAATLRVRSSFHVPPFNSIDHVHMHAFVDDQAMLGVYGRLKYRTESWWCRSYDDVLARLDDGPQCPERGPQDDDDGGGGGFPATSTPDLGGQQQLLRLTA